MKHMIIFIIIINIVLLANYAYSESNDSSKKQSQKKPTKSHSKKTQKSTIGFRNIKFGTDYDEVKKKLAIEFSSIMEENKELQQIKLGDLLKISNNYGNKDYAYKLAQIPVEVLLNFDKKNKFSSFEINGYFIPNTQLFFSSYENIYEIMLAKYGIPKYSSPYEKYDFHTQVGMENIRQGSKSFTTIVDYWDDGGNSVFMGLKSNYDNNKYNTFVKVVPHKTADSLSDILKKQLENETADDINQSVKEFKKFKGIMDGVNSF